MAGEIEAAVQAGLAILRSIDGLRNSPDYPPDNPHAYPVLVGAASEGVWITESDGLHGLHTIRFGFYTTRQNLPKDMVTILPFGEKAKDKLLCYDNAYWNGAITGYSDRQAIEYTFGDIEYYPGLFLIGWTLRVVVKIRYRWNGTSFEKG